MQSSPRYVFGSSDRQKKSFYDSASKHNPGPGTYALPNTSSSCHSMTPRRPDTAPQVGLLSPGPAAYQSTLNPTLKQAPAYKLGSSQRQPLSIPSMLKTPGPQAYDLSFTQDLKMKRAPVNVFGTSKRRPLNQDSGAPGPGNYPI